MQAVAACGSTGATVADPAQPITQYVLERETRDRWLNGAQPPEFTPFVRTTSTLYLDVAPGPGTGERTLRLAMRARTSGDSSTLTVGRDGRIVRQQTWLGPTPPVPFRLPGDSGVMERFRLHENTRLMLPSARTWDVVPLVRPRRFAAGERWTDTITLATELDGARQTVDGRRWSVLVRDTVVAGRRHWLVRDSARVRYTERDLERERTLATFVGVERDVSGTTRSTYLYDQALGLFVWREDSASLTGSAVLRYPDGRSFRTPTRFERTRRWTLYDPQTFAARQAAARDEARRRLGGTVRPPANEVERRLAAGDSLFRDSLVRVWERERDPDAREQLYRELMMWGGRAGSFRTSIDARRAAAGDTAFILRQLSELSLRGRQAISADAARQLIRVMADPAIPFSLGLSRDVPYENLVQTFVTSPPALTPQAQWPCVPDACRLLGEQWRDAREPRLRDVGLTILVAMDPARWSDTVLARAATGSPVIASAALLVNGVGAQWPVAAKLPMPPAGAGWRAWLAWSTANDPRYQPPPAVRPTQTVMRFEERHATAIRFHQLRTGRDVVGELRAARAAATDDSARMVFGTILDGLGDRSSVEEVAAEFRSGSPPQIALAERELRGLFRARAPLADSATTIAVLGRLIASVVDGTVPWPSLTPTRDSTPPPRNPVGSPARPNLFVLADSVPPVLRDRWRDRVRFIGTAEWQRMPAWEAASLLTLSSVERMGPFVRVRTHHSGRLARQPNETPWLFYGGENYYLLARDDGWVVVSMDMWAT